MIYVDYMVLGARLRTARHAAGLSIVDAAKKAGISHSFYSHVERGSRKPSLETVIRMMNALSVTPNAIFLEQTMIKASDEVFDQLHGLLYDLQKKHDAFCIPQ